MNRSLLYGFVAGLGLAVLVGLVAYRSRAAPATAPSPAEAAASPVVPAAAPAGRYQLVSSIELLMLDTASGELWFYRKGKWHRGAGAPRDDGDRSAVLGEAEDVPAPEETAGPEPAAPVPEAAPTPEERGRAEVIQVEAAPEKPEKAARRR